MKKLIYLLCLLICFNTLHGQQVKPLWSKTIPEGVNWQMITSLGNYIVGTSKGLTGIDPETGEIIWKNESLGMLSSEMVNQLGSSALIMIDNGSNIHILDPFSGKIKFDAGNAGIRSITDTKILYEANGILISGRNEQNKDILLMSSMEDGQVKWKIEDDFGRFITASELAPDELLIVTMFYNYKLNPANGEIIWKNDVSEANKQLEKLGALGGLVKQAATNAAQSMEFNVQFYQHPDRPIFYIASEQEGQPAATGGFTSTTTTGSGPSYHTTYSAFDMTNGDRIWANPLDLSGKIGGVYFDTDGIVIMPDDGANTKINSYDYQSQEGKWGKKGRGVKIKGGIYTYEKVKDGFVLVSQNTAGKNFISYLDQKTATLPFDKPVRIDGTLVYSEITAKGLFFITTQEVNILDINTGQLLLDKGIPTEPSLTTQEDDNVYIFSLRDNSLLSLNKNTAALKVMKAGIQFEGKEAPENIEIRENGILVSAAQNVALVGFDGEVLYQKYFEAPRDPGIIRALKYAQAVRAAYIGAVAYSASAAYQSAGQQAKANNEQVGGMVLEGIGGAYGELGDAASDFAKKSWQSANARYKATQNADNDMVILAREDKNNTLVKINKTTGVIGGTIDLGKDNKPNYTMDGVTGMVFYSVGGGAISSYKF